jgi:HSP20 family protein
MNKWDPLKDLLSIRERMNRLFEDTLGSGEGSSEIVSAGTWSPVVDIYETGTEFIVKAEVPEVQQSDIDIRVKDTMITIEGERNVHRSMMEGYHRIERAYGKFQRSFLLPGLVDKEGIKATLRDGVLKIVLPKKDIVITKQIEITDT